MTTGLRSVAAVLAVAIACSAQAGDSDPVLATTDLTVVRRSDLERWSPIIEPRRRELRRLADDPSAVERYLLEEIALIDIALADGGRLVGAAERADLWWMTLGRRLRATYLREVVAPMVEVTDADARRIYDRYRANYQKPDAVAVLEIFRWAPVDLPELRREAERQLDELASTITSPEDFKRAARAVSDATSALEGGSVGAIYRDSVDERLARALFGGGLGMTEVVATEHGLYLFWVARRLPAIDNSFGDVRERIERRLRRQRVERLTEIDRERLIERYDVVLRPQNGIAFTVAGEPYGLPELGLGPEREGDDDSQVLVERATTVLYGLELERLGLCPPEDPVLEYRFALAETAFNLLVDRAWRELKLRPTPGPTSKSAHAPEIERWSFDMLTVDGHPEAYFELLRIRHELGGRAGLEEVRDRLLASTGIEADLESFADVLAPEVSPLGPEIHQTLKLRLAPGELSRPLAVGGRLVMLELAERRLDDEASQAARRDIRQRRALVNLAADTRARLLANHDFSVTDAALDEIEKGTGPGPVP